MLDFLCVYDLFLFWLWLFQNQVFLWADSLETVILELCAILYFWFASISAEDVLFVEDSALFEIAQLTRWHFHVALLQRMDFAMPRHLWLRIDHDQISITLPISLAGILMIKVIAVHSWSFPITIASSHTKQILNVLLQIEWFLLVLIKIIEPQLICLQALLEPRELFSIMNFGAPSESTMSSLQVAKLPPGSVSAAIQILSRSPNSFELALAISKVLYFRWNKLAAQISRLSLNENFAVDEPVVLGVHVPWRSSSWAVEHMLRKKSLWFLILCLLLYPCGEIYYSVAILGWVVIWSGRMLTDEVIRWFLLVHEYTFNLPLLHRRRLPFLLARSDHRITSSLPASRILYNEVQISHWLRLLLLVLFLPLHSSVQCSLLEDNLLHLCWCFLRVVDASLWDHSASGCVSVNLDFVLRPFLHTVRGLFEMDDSRRFVLHGQFLNNLGLWREIDGNVLTSVQILFENWVWLLVVVSWSWIFWYVKSYVLLASLPILLFLNQSCWIYLLDLLWGVSTNIWSVPWWKHLLLVVVSSTWWYNFSYKPGPKSFLILILHARSSSRLHHPRASFSQRSCPLFASLIRGIPVALLLHMPPCSRPFRLALKLRLHPRRCYIPDAVRSRYVLTPFLFYYKLALCLCLLPLLDWRRVDVQ